MTDADQLRRLLLERSVRRGDFVLASGQRSSYYIDCRLTHHERRGHGADRAHGLAAITAAGWRPRAVGGLTMGADPVAYAIAAASWGTTAVIDAFSVRKEAKDHGTGQLIEGNFRAGRRGGGGGGRDHLGRVGAQGDRGGRGGRRPGLGRAGGGGSGAGRSRSAGASRSQRSIYYNPYSTRASIRRSEGSLRLAAGRRRPSCEPNRGDLDPGAHGPVVGTRPRQVRPQPSPTDSAQLDPDLQRRHPPRSSRLASVRVPCRRNWSATREPPMASPRHGELVEEIGQHRIAHVEDARPAPRDRGRAAPGAA